MRTFYLSIVILLMMCLETMAQSYDVSLIPDSLRNRADAVVRQEVITIDMQSPNKVLYRMKQAITVFNPAGERKARLVVFYDKSTSLGKVKGLVFDQDGIQTAKFSQKDFRDESAVSSFSLYEDSRVKHYLPAVNRYPYTVEYEYEIQFKQNLIIPDWRPNHYSNVAIMNSQYTFICNESDQLNIQALNYPGEANESSINGKKNLTWELNNVPARRPEPFSPDPETYQTVVKIAPTDFVFYKKKGTYQNWAELGKWKYNELLAEGYTLPAHTIQEVKELVKDVTSDREKAKILYSYMQEKTRYISVQIGIGGFKPITASDVDRLGYGDCKGLVSYMQSLLMAVDIPSYYCVVNAGNAKKDMHPDFANMAQGNHVILYLPFENDPVWLECTNSKSPFGFLGTFTDDRTVWACTPDGGKILKTPKMTATENSQLRDAHITMDTEGNISGNISTVFRGSQYNNHFEISEVSGNEQVKLLKQAYDIDNISFTHANYLLDENEPSLTETLEIQINKYAPTNSGHIYLVPNVFNRIGPVPVMKDRQLPVYVNRGFTDKDSITYTLPDGYSISQDWEGTDIKTPFGHFRQSLKQEGNLLTFYREQVLNEGTYPAETYQEFAKFMNKINAVDNSKIIVNTGRE